MKAVVLYKHGGIEELHYQDFEDPKPSNTDALIKIHACSLNHLDIWVRKGIKGSSIKFPHIAGSDIAGELMNDVDGFKKGDRVLVYPGLSCMRCKYCLDGNEPLCKEFTIIGGFNDTQGGYAEYIAVPKHNIIYIPDHLSYEEAASINISHLTAWNMLNIIEASKGKTILIYAAGSGVGSAAIQFAKAMGCNVITTVGSSDKLDKALKLRPDLVIDRSKEDILYKIKGFEIDGIIDHVGASTLAIDLQVIRIGGKISICGATSGDVSEINLRTLYNKRVSIHGVYLGSKKQLIDMLRFMEENGIRPIIDSILPLEKAREAHKRMEDSKHFGKIVLKP